MLKKSKLVRIILLPIFMLLFLAAVHEAWAEVVIFRVPLQGNIPGTNIQRGACYPMSLSENLSEQGLPENKITPCSYYNNILF